MPRNLRALIIASGYAGTAGQSFRNHVTGAATGATMREYLITAISFSGAPTNTTYSEDQTFTLVATFTRGSRAYNIQRNVSGAWAFFINNNTEPNYGGGTVTVESFSSAGSPNGATHTIAIRVRGFYSSTGTVSGTAEVSPAYPDPNAQGQRPLRFIAGYDTPSPGTSSIDVTGIYTPDTGSFNNLIETVWPFTMYNRANDPGAIEVQWHRTNAYTDASPYTNFTEDVTYDPIVYAAFGSPYEGVTENGSASMWLRWRVVGASSWTNYGQVQGVWSV